MSGKKVTEKELTKSIRHLLRVHCIFHYKAWQGALSEKGIADIIGIYRGKPLAIEVKTDRGRLSEHQERFLTRFAAAGGTAFVARSPGDVVRELGLLILEKPGDFRYWIRLTSVIEYFGLPIDTWKTGGGTSDAIR